MDLSSRKSVHRLIGFFALGESVRTLLKNLHHGILIEEFLKLIVVGQPAPHWTYLHGNIEVILHPISIDIESNSFFLVVPGLRIRFIINELLLEIGPIFHEYDESSFEQPKKIFVNFLILLTQIGMFLLHFLSHLIIRDFELLNSQQIS